MALPGRPSAIIRPPQFVVDRLPSGSRRRRGVRRNLQATASETVLAGDADRRRCCSSTNQLLQQSHARRRWENTSRTPEVVNLLIICCRRDVFVYSLAKLRENGART